MEAITGNVWLLNEYVFRGWECRWKMRMGWNFLRYLYLFLWDTSTCTRTRIQHYIFAVISSSSLSDYTVHKQTTPCHLRDRNIHRPRWFEQSDLPFGERGHYAKPQRSEDAGRCHGRAGRILSTKVIPVDDVRVPISQKRLLTPLFNRRVNTGQWVTAILAVVEVLRWDVNAILQ